MDPFRAELLSGSAHEGVAFEDLSDSVIAPMCYAMRRLVDADDALRSELARSESWVERFVHSGSVAGIERRVGRFVWLAGSRFSDDERVVTARVQTLAGLLRTRAGAPSALSDFVTAWSMEQEQWCRLLWAGRWHESGLPVVRLDGKTIAALLFSDSERLCDVDADELMPPWPAFRISLADLPLPMHRHTGEIALVKSIEVHRLIITGGEGKPGDIVTSAMRPDLQGRATYWRVSAVDHSSLKQVMTMRLGGLSHLSTVREMDARPVDEDSGEINQADANVRLHKWGLFLTGRLIVGAIALMNRDKIGLERPAPSLSQRRAAVGHHWDPEVNYIVREDVSVDFRDHVHGFAIGDAKVHRACQWVTRGHWRQQPCGPALSERKRIWIHPHWNNRDGGPIVIRDHRLSTEGVDK